MSTNLSAHSAQKSIPSTILPGSTADGDAMGKPNVPILEIRPFNGGLRRFAVPSLEPVASGDGVAYSDDEEGGVPVSMDIWERIESRGVVVRVREKGADPDDYIGTCNQVAWRGRAENALLLAWGLVMEHYDDNRLGLPNALLRVARDYDATVNPPEVE